MDNIYFFILGCLIGSLVYLIVSDISWRKEEKKIKKEREERLLRTQLRLLDQRIAALKANIFQLNTIIEINNKKQKDKERLNKMSKTIPENYVCGFSVTDDDDWVACKECYFAQQGDCENVYRYDGCEFGVKDKDIDV